MAKALLGHVNSDVRTTSVLAVENSRLRRRVDGWVLPELFEESEVRVFTQPVVDG